MTYKLNWVAVTCCNKGGKVRDVHRTYLHLIHQIVIYGTLCIFNYYSSPTACAIAWTDYIIYYKSLLWAVAAGRLTLLYMYIIYYYNVSYVYESIETRHPRINYIKWPLLLLLYISMIASKSSVMIAYHHGVCVCISDYKKVKLRSGLINV